jgi:acetyl-CoA carboxylase biotin carboxyl carrier protein
MLKKRLEELIEFVESTDLQEVVWEKKGSLISFRRSVPSEKVSSSAAKAAAAAPAPTRSANGTAPVAKPAEAMTIKSTMVGTFFRSDSPDHPPFVVEGTVVAEGQAVGAIEAMKIMKDVIAPKGCKIVRVLVANGHPVEYGQPLFEIEHAMETANV